MSNGASLPSFITYDAADRNFTLNTTDNKKAGNYSIHVTGIANDLVST